MPKETTPTTSSHETPNRKLAYDLEFRKMLREHPGIIKRVKELADQAIKEYDPKDFKFGENGITIKYDKKTRKWKQPIYIQNEDRSAIITEYKDLNYGRCTILVPGQTIKDENRGVSLDVTLLGVSNRKMNYLHYTRFDECEYFKISLNGQSFFVKRSFVSVNPGFIEFQNTMKARNILADLDYVKVVEAKLGYQDTRESWYVSKWENLETTGFETLFSNNSFDDYGKVLTRPDDPDEFSKFENEQEEAIKKSKIIIARLKKEHFVDLRQNIFYNYKTGKFIVLDPTEENEKYDLGNPIKYTSIPS